MQASAKLIHRYAFEGFGTVPTDSVGEQHGTFVGGAKLTGDGTITLDGANDYVALPGGLLTNLDDATLETWVTWDGPSSESWNRIFEFGKDDLHYLYLTPRTGSSPRHARFGIAAGGPERKINAEDQLPGDGTTRSHIVVTFDGATRRVTFYLDGVEQGGTTATVPLKGFADDHAWLGKSHFSWVPMFEGKIHEFRIYDHALSGQQVQKNFSSGPDFLPGPVIHDFTADRTKVHSGTNVQLTWAISEGATGTIDPGGIPVNALTGTVEVLVLADAIYTLTVADAEGVRSASLEIKIDDRPEIRAFTATPESLAAGGEVTLQWDVAFADRILLDNTPVTGTSHKTKVAGPHAFELAAENRYGSRKASITVHVESGGAVRISEFLAANDNGLADEYGESSDWIEIENTGKGTVDLAEWFLSDDPANLQMWAFPAGTTLAAGGRLIVRASGRGIPATKGELHANFKVGSDKDGFLAIVHKDGAFGNYFYDYPKQRTDFSFGLDAEGQSAFFASPTPGQSNAASGLLGFVKDTKFSHDRGFFEQPFLLAVTSGTPDAIIYCTTDGSLPGPGNAAAFIYGKPVPISTTTSFRSRAFLDGFEPSNTDTHTYFFLQDVLKQSARPKGYPSVWAPNQTADYAMDPRIVNSATYKDRILPALRSHPTIALTMDVDAMFGNSPGIYSHPTSKGENWEIPASVELMDFPWASDKQEDCGLRMQGNANRQPSRPKHNMRLVFRDRYGAGRLNFKLFEDAAAEKFNNLILRGQNGDSWIHPNATQRLRATFLRDQWHRAARKDMGHETINQSHVHVYVNGLYWGFFHLFERAEAEMMAENHGGQPSDYDVVQDFNKTPGKIEVLDGTIDAWNAMFPLANEVAAGSKPWTDMRQLVDMENFVDYMVLNFFTGNYDWDKGNWRAGRLRGADSPGWWFFSWDSERTLWTLSKNSTGINFASRASSLHQILARDADYRLLFADRVHKLLHNDGTLSTARASEIWNAMADEVRLPLVAESARWGDAHRASNPYTPDVNWAKESAWMTDIYFKERPAIMLDQLRTRNLYPTLEPPTFSQRGGRIDSGTILNLSAPKGDICYTTDGTDPRLSDGSLNPAAIQGEALQITKALTLNARVRDGAIWSPLTEASFSVDLRLRISEIHYHPKDATHSEFIEILNTGAGPASLDGVSFTDGIEFTFPTGVTLAAGERILLVSNKNAFTQIHAGVVVGGVFDGKLRNEGERIALSTLTGEILFEVTYDNKTPWPMSAAGGGRTLVLTDGADPTDPKSWRPSSNDGGSPGAENPDPSGDSDADGLPDDWELQHFGDFNQTAGADFDGDDLANLLEYAFGSSPADPGSANLPTPSIHDGQYLAVTYERRSDANLTYIIQLSDDLKSWTSDVASVQTVSIVTNGLTETVTVRENKPITGRNIRFLRVQAVTP